MQPRAAAPHNRRLLIDAPVVRRREWSLSAPIRWLHELRLSDLNDVGGKNSSLGEMIGHLSDLGVSVPGGFATTAEAFRTFLSESGLRDSIYARLNGLDTNDIDALNRTGRAIREELIASELTPELDRAIRAAYARLEVENGDGVAVAVRSSATAEDLPDASFAGQQETFLNVSGIEQVLLKVKEVFASLFNDRAIAYRVHHGFAHADVALSAGVQLMVRSDLASSGVLFTLDTESGFRDVVFVTASYGLGETVVQGAVNPDEFYVHKPTLNAGRPAIVKRTLGAKAIKMVYADPSLGRRGVATVDVDLSERRCFALSDSEVEELSRQALKIEAHYGRPMDIEWAKDGVSGKLFIVQARPETVKSQARTQVQERFHLQQRGELLCEGRSIGQKIGAGRAQVIRSIHEMDRLKPGDVLVTDMTDPDWEPVMKRASAIVTNRGGRTCHAAIIARELGIPAVVGCGNATRAIGDGNEVTVSCAEGDTGFIYDGLLPFDVLTADFGAMPPPPLKVMMNVGNPERAFDFAQIPNHGVGLARLEFIINNTIGIHPKALLNYDQQEPLIRQQIDERIAGYASPVDFYVDRLTEGMATIACAFAPHPVIIRLSDFKSNEYANLIGGRGFEPHEENPMIGFRGAARYVSENFKDCFELECRAVKRVRDQMGLTNAWIMIPFVRTVAEAKGVIARLKEFGLERGHNGLKVIMMCELPSNALLAEAFLEHFDGFSIGSNDLTQLTLGLDRDSGIIANLFDERNDAVKVLIARAIKACRAAGKYIGICGQGPSDHPDLAQWLLAQGIESVSLNPDTVLDTWMLLAKSKP
jgi:pyruvate, water dikinase